MDRRRVVASWTLIGALALLAIAALVGIARASATESRQADARSRAQALIVELAQAHTAAGDQARAYDAQIADMRWQQALQLARLEKEKRDLTQQLRAARARLEAETPSLF